MSGGVHVGSYVSDTSEECRLCRGEVWGEVWGGVYMSLLHAYFCHNAVFDSLVSPGGFVRV